MSQVLHITSRGERSEFESDRLEDCVTEANRLNDLHGFRAGARVVVRDDGERLTADECRAFAS